MGNHMRSRETGRAVQEIAAGAIAHGHRIESGRTTAPALRALSPIETGRAAGGGNANGPR